MTSIKKTKKILKKLGYTLSTSEIKSLTKLKWRKYDYNDKALPKSIEYSGIWILINYNGSLHILRLAYHQNGSDWYEYKQGFPSYHSERYWNKRLAKCYWKPLPKYWNVYNLSYKDFIR